MLERLEDRSLLAGFNFTDFADSTPLTLLGDAAITADQRLRLTPAAGGQEGAAWYTLEKQFVGFEFSTAFQFQLADNYDAIPGGSDGFVFLIQNYAPSFLSGGGGTLGYYRMPNSLAIEFDTFQNSEVSDPSGSHISVHTNGTGPNDWSESLSLGSYNTNPIMDDAQVHTAKITYAQGTLSIYLDNLTTPVLAINVNLAEQLDLDAGRAWIGFTGTTGGGYQTHDVLNWSFASTIPATILNIDDASVIEGNAGTANLVFNVTRSGDLAAAANVNWNTQNGSATAASGDYVARSGQLTFAPNEPTQTITIAINGDSTIEAHESLSIVLSGATGAAILDGKGMGTILTDDTSVAISDATAAEGGSSLKNLGRFVADGSGGLATPNGSTFGPDGNGDGVQDLYVTSRDADAILRYDGVTGSFISTFVPSGSGGLDFPTCLVFSPNGHLFVSSETLGMVFEYDGSGAFLGVPVSGLTHGATPPAYSLAFGPDGNLYIANSGADEVLRFDGTNLTTFVSPGSGGLDRPRRAVFGPDGNLYVASTDTRQVLRFNGQTGAFMSVFATNALPGTGPAWLEFGTDGYMYTSSRNDSTAAPTSILRYNAATGAFVDALDLGRDGWSFTLGADNMVYNSSNSAGSFIDRLGPSSWAPFTVSLVTPSAAPVTVTYSTANGSAIAGSDYQASSGTITFVPGETSHTILVQSLDDSLVETSETFVVNLSSPIGAVIADGQGVGTIVDNDSPPTKFYVANDGSPDRTFEYTASGSSVENYTVATGNTAPRGAASNLAGDKVWVVDANRNVYVYNANGGSLGQWSLGDFNNSAQLEGISVSGNDVWIVDAKSDKVYRYTGAASRLSGSQSAASSFSLNSANKDASDLVTDGASIWILNNTSSTDKVFKYTVGGSLLGSWTITSGGGSPTGITIDPSNATMDMWIVDSGSDKVYRLAGARTTTSGSVAAGELFALASTNTNPQGIADPPVAAMGGTTPTLSPSSDSSFEAALLAVVTEFDDLLLLGGKKRKYR